MTTYVDATYEHRRAGLERFTFPGFRLSNGEFFGPVDVAYKTYGKLSPQKDNVIFVCHSVSGDPHVSDFYPNSTIPGWWSKLIGPGKYIDTNKFFVLCPNVFGGCYGTTGPASKNPKTGKPYGSSFPKFSLKDVIACHQQVLEHLEIDRVRAVFGGSFGGSQVIQWMAAFPDSIEKAVPMAASPSTPALVLAFNYIVKKILTEDSRFHGGDYYEKGQPVDTIALSRFALELQFISPHELQQAYGRRKIGDEFAVAQATWEKSLKFARRFDANSFLQMLRAVDEFDLGQDEQALRKSFAQGDYETLGIAVRTDTLYPPEEMKRVISARKANGKKAEYHEIDSPNGHDSFFTEIGLVGPAIRKFIDAK